LKLNYIYLRGIANTEEARKKESSNNKGFLKTSSKATKSLHSSLANSTKGRNKYFSMRNQEWLYVFFIFIVLYIYLLSLEYVSDLVFKEKAQ